MERIEMTSRSLQKHFPDFYRGFFGMHDFVMSGTFSMSWGPGGVGHRSEYARVKSKIPLKLFIGINKRNDNLINIDNLIYYDIVNKKFETIEYTKINNEKDKIIKEIRKILEKYNYKGGFDINFLSETGIGHSFGFSGVSGSLMVTGIYCLIGEINKEDLLNNYDKFLNSQIFDEISLLSWKIDFISTYGNTSGHGVMNVFQNSNSPSLMFTEKFDEKLDIEELGKIRRFFYPLSNKFRDTAITSNVMLDYGIIFSGNSTDTKNIEEIRKGHIKKTDIYANFIKNELLDDNVDLDNIKFSKFIEKDTILQHLNETASIVGMKIIYLFKKLLEHGYEQDIADEFIDIINQSRYSISLIEKQNSFSNDLNYVFKKNKTNKDEKLGITPIYGGKIGGGFLFVLKPGISRNTILKTLEELKNNLVNIEIEYASWLDGDCSDGVVLEQYISKGVFSKYVSKNNVVYKDSEGSIYVGEYDELLNDNSDGLILDLISKKIIYKGEKLTSKEISSQNATIDILSILLDNIGKDVSNKSFPSSSYSKNKNEMLSKIIIPLNKLINTNSQKDFEIKCTGSLTDFYLTLEKPIIPVGIIKKINSMS